MNDMEALTRLVHGSGPMLLDFDGPVCSVFAGYPATKVADHLITTLEAGLVSSDPLEVVRWASTKDRDLLLRAEDELRTAEVQAVRSAYPTPYARECIVAAREVGKPVAVVSNNCARAISSYLRAHRLDHHVSTIVGRPYGRPGEMKPNPISLVRALEQLGVSPESAVFVGDSTSDVIAGQAADVPVVGLANKKGKQERLSRAGADAVIPSMEILARTLMELAS